MWSGAAPRLAAGVVAAVVATTPAFGQTRAPARDGIVIVTGQEATLPIPTLMEGPASTLANSEVADQLFLRLVQLGPALTTAGDSGFVPLLARAWTRRDSVTLAFELDPRARWHDGVPVTARDVIFTFERARNPVIAPKLSALLRRIVSVTAESERRVVFRFSYPYAEQLYDATFHVAPLPFHLLRSLPAASLRQSEFARRPVGSGPYRWVRREPGQFIELVANPAFFLGAPRIRRLFIRVATDPDARLNLLLSGEADAVDNIPPPRANLDRVASDRSLRLLPVGSGTMGYLLFNTRDRHDQNRPHAILRDIRVRRAIGLALDRQLMVQSVFGSYGAVPYGPASALLWIRHGAPRATGPNVAKARQLLTEAGWRDADGDGTLDRAGLPLELGLTLPNTSAIRRQIAVLAQEQLRAVGVRLRLEQVDGPIWNERRTAGDFDLDFSAVFQDPSPSGLTQAWSCAGGTNVAHFCDPVLDTLMERATLARAPASPGVLWHDVLQRIEADAPAVFLYTPIYVAAVRRRFDNVRIRPESNWLLLREWSPAGTGARAPGAAAPR